MSQNRGKWQSQCFTVCYTSIAHDTFRVAGQWSVPGNNASDFLSGKWPSQCFTVCRASIGWTLLELLINEILSHVLQDVCLFIKEARGDTKLHQTRRQTRVHGQSPCECDNFIWFCSKNHWFQWLWSWVNKQNKILQVPKFGMTIGKFAFIFHYTLSNLILAMNICFLFMSHIQLKSVELTLSANQFIFWFLLLIAVLAYKIDGS